MQSDLDRLERRLERVETRHEELAAEFARINREQAEQATAALGTLTTRLDALQAALRDQLAGIEGRQGSLQAEVTDLGGAISKARAAEASEVSQRLEMLASALAALTMQVDGLHAELRTARMPTAAGAAPSVAVSPAPLAEARPAPLVPPAAPGTEPRPGTERQPHDLYERAYTDFSRGNYALAIGGFREFLRRHPDDSAADNAQYWMGEAYLALAQRYQNENEIERAKQALQDAVLAFRRVVERYAAGDQVAGALYREAHVLLELQEPAQARARLEYLIEQFPGTPEARVARERISQLEER